MRNNERFRAEAIALVAKLTRRSPRAVEAFVSSARKRTPLQDLDVVVRETERRLRGDEAVRQILALSDLINKRLSSGNHTFDELIRECDWASDLNRSIKAAAERYLGGQ